MNATLYPIWTDMVRAEAGCEHTTELRFTVDSLPQSMHELPGYFGTASLANLSSHPSLEYCSFSFDLWKPPKSCSESLHALTASTELIHEGRMESPAIRYQALRPWAKAHLTPRIADALVMFYQCSQIRRPWWKRRRCPAFEPDRWHRLAERMEARLQGRGQPAAITLSRQKGSNQSPEDTANVGLGTTQKTGKGPNRPLT